MKAESYNESKFETQTANMLKNPDFRDWFKHFKFHPSIMYYASSTLMGKGTDSGGAYFDGTKEPFRIVDHISITRNLGDDAQPE